MKYGQYSEPTICPGGIVFQSSAGVSGSYLTHHFRSKHPFMWHLVVWSAFFAFFGLNTVVYFTGASENMRLVFGCFLSIGIAHSGGSSIGL